MTRIKATTSFECQAGVRGLLGMFTLASTAAALTTKVSIAGPPDGYGDKLGSVNFPTSCNAAAQPLMERGLALLHHMTYKGAERAFDAAQKADPDCALAYWGIAMSFIHPVWPDRPSIVQFARAADLLAMANSRGRKTPRESAYIEALNSYYANAQERDERSRLASHAAAWAEVYKAFPDDLEAAAIAALAHLATASFLDKSNRKPKTAGAMAEEVLARNPEHPGGHHYVIHSYDFPDLAKRALGVARRYGRLAPEVPHALHMPTHIFTRLGLWEESIAWNLRSSASALKRGGAGAYAHTLDYLGYAYLQQAQDEKAAEILKTVHNLPTPFYWSKSGSFGYALAGHCQRKLA